MQSQEVNPLEPDALPNSDQELTADLKSDDIILQKPKRRRKRDEDPNRNYRSVLIGVVVGVLYGLLARLALGASPYSTILIFGNDTMTFGFLGFVPLAIGALGVIFTPRSFRTRYRYTSSIALWTTLTWLVIVSVTALEAVVCIAMASPIVLLMSQAGSLLMSWMFRQIERRRYGGGMVKVFSIVLIIAPYMIAPAEGGSATPVSVGEVQTQVTIHASVQTIWRDMLRVPTIQPSERHFSIPNLIGLPQPIEASLNRESVGGVRYTKLTYGVAFVETITDWQDLKTIAYTIRADVSKNTQPPFDQIGGPNFTMIDGAYLLEPIGNSNVILHLNSRYELTTHFNAYGSLWVDFILRDLQNQVLGVIKERAEQGS